MKPPIQTESFLHRGKTLVSIRELDRAQRMKLAQWLKPTYLNALYQGKATFSLTRKP